MSAPASGHFDARYAETGYWYGTEPNDFLRAQAHLFAPGGRVLCLGEGEGRNAVFLASLGHRVVAVDASSVGLDKALTLARARGVAIETVHADLADFPLGSEAWDGIVSIWCHLAPKLRARVHRECVLALKPGGLFLLEAYTPAQLAFGSGGPKEVELLPTLQALRTELAGLETVIQVECERQIHEGRGHNGLSAVVQFVGRRPGRVSPAA